MKNNIQVGKLNSAYRAMFQVVLLNAEYRFSLADD